MVIQERPSKKTNVGAIVINEPLPEAETAEHLRLPQ